MASRNLKVGQIGLGNLGFLMARSIAARGFPFTVCDLRQQPVEEMKTLGAKGAATPREVAAASDIVVSIVNDIDDTENIIFGKDGVLEAAKRGSAILICSTIGSRYAKTVYDRAGKQGIRILDVGMSKEGPGEEIGSLTVMVGGDKADFDFCKPVFEAMARHVFHVGPIGSGQAFKVINNLLGIAIGSVTREALNVGAKAGLDLDMMIEVMKVSTGGSWSLNYMDFLRKSRRGAAGFESVARPAPTKNIGLKDWTLAKEYADSVGAEIPIAQFIHDLDTMKLYKALAEAQAKA